MRLAVEGLNEPVIRRPTRTREIQRDFVGISSQIQSVA